MIPKFLIKQTYNFPLFPLKPPHHDQEFSGVYFKTNKKYTNKLVTLDYGLKSNLSSSILRMFFKPIKYQN
jgi:hypothetical protein